MLTLVERHQGAAGASAAFEVGVPCTGRDTASAPGAFDLDERREAGVLADVLDPRDDALPWERAGDAKSARRAFAAREQPIHLDPDSIPGMEALLTRVVHRYALGEPRGERKVTGPTRCSPQTVGREPGLVFLGWVRIGT